MMEPSPSKAASAMPWFHLSSILPPWLRNKVPGPPGPASENHVIPSRHIYEAQGPSREPLKDHAEHLSSRCIYEVPGPPRSPVHEVFWTRAKWQHDEESNSSQLLIDLEGLEIDDMKVTIEGRKLCVRVRAELSDYFSIFLAESREDYSIPEDCNMAKITAKFEWGILAITIPKESAD